MVNVDQQHNMPTQTPNKIDNVRITVILWCGCVEKQKFVHILRVGLQTYRSTNQSACAILPFHVFRV